MVYRTRGLSVFESGLSEIHKYKPRGVVAIDAIPGGVRDERVCCVPIPDDIVSKQPLSGSAAVWPTPFILKRCIR